MAPFSIRSMRLNDVDTVVDIHLQSYRSFFLTFLGQRFLRELYLSIVVEPTGMGFVYEQDSNIQGFVVGTDQPHRFYLRLLWRRWWRFGIASVSALGKKPTILPRLMRAFTMPSQARTPDGCGTLMSIAVAPRLQGQGIGHKLMHAFLDEAVCRGLRQVNLLTDKVNNDSINRFYQGYGFYLYRSFITPEGREMNDYRIDLTVNRTL